MRYQAALHPEAVIVATGLRAAWARRFGHDRTTGVAGLATRPPAAGRGSRSVPSRRAVYFFFAFAACCEAMTTKVTFIMTWYSAIWPFLMTAL